MDTSVKIPGGAITLPEWDVLEDDSGKFVVMPFGDDCLWCERLERLGDSANDSGESIVSGSLNTVGRPSLMPRAALAFRRIKKTKSTVAPMAINPPIVTQTAMITVVRFDLEPEPELLE